MEKVRAKYNFQMDFELSCMDFVTHFFMSVFHLQFLSRPGDKTFSSLFATGISLIPRYLAVIVVGISYLVLRHHFDTLSIPDGLIRPAENPFYEFTGTKRILSYSLVFTVHIGKVFLIDPIGFAHEYGFNCLPAVDNAMEDMRLIFPIIMCYIFVSIAMSCLRNGLETSLLFLVGLSWVFTLFPISGVMKVGTFIADRIIVPSTVTFAIFGGVLITKWLYGEKNGPGNTKGSNSRFMLAIKYGVIAALLTFMGFKVTTRGNDWMNSVSLIESSLKNCPNSAKSNLEMSKVHSGMYHNMFDLDKSL